jgi:hypothetical protein
MAAAYAELISPIVKRMAWTAIFLQLLAKRKLLPRQLQLSKQYQ